jgi:hypothetical protein
MRQCLIAEPQGNTAHHHYLPYGGLEIFAIWWAMPTLQFSLYGGQCPPYKFCYMVGNAHPWSLDIFNWLAVPPTGVWAFFIVWLRHGSAAAWSQLLAIRLSWFPSVSGSESGSGSIPTVYRGLVVTHVVATLPEFRQHRQDAVQQGFTGRVPCIRFLVSKSHLLSFDSDSDTDPDPDYN